MQETNANIAHYHMRDDTQHVVQNKFAFDDARERFVITAIKRRAKIYRALVVDFKCTAHNHSGGTRRTARLWAIQTINRVLFHNIFFSHKHLHCNIVFAYVLAVVAPLCNTNSQLVIRPCSSARTTVYESHVNVMQIAFACMFHTCVSFHWCEVWSDIHSIVIRYAALLTGICENCICCQCAE